MTINEEMKILLTIMNINDIIGNEEMKWHYYY